MSLLTVTEFASRLRVSRATAWRWVQRGDVRVLRIGRVTRVRDEDVDQLIETHSSGQEKPPAGPEPRRGS